MKHLWLCLVLAAVLLMEVPAQTETETPDTETAIKHNASYWMVLSNKLRFGDKIKAIMYVFPNHKSVTVTASITYENYDLNNTLTSRTLHTWVPIEVLPGAPQTLTFDTPLNLKVKNDEDYGQYKINIIGQGETLNFEKQGELTPVQKVVSIFPITDKLIYIPGQTVHIRAVVMDDATMRILNEPMDITITDPKGNIIKQQFGVRGPDSLGVVQDSLKLAPSVLLGDWIISVTAMGQTETKIITTDNYVLPKFTIEIKIPPICLSSDKTYTITISAEYTFEKPVDNGYVNVNVTRYQPWMTKSKNMISYSGKLNIHGKFEIRLQKKQLLRLLQADGDYSDLDYKSFSIDAYVIEGLTKKVMNASAIMNINKSPVKVMFSELSPKTFKPGLKSIVYFQLKQVDDNQLSPDMANIFKAYINVTYDVLKAQNQSETSETNSSSDAIEGKIAVGRGIWRPQQLTETKILKIDKPVQTFPETGFLNVSFTVPEEATSVMVQVYVDKFEDTNTAYHYMSKYMSPTGSYLQLQAVSTKTPRVGETIPITAVTTESVNQIYYQVLSKGVLLLNGTVTSPTTDGSNVFSFEVQVSGAMPPSITVFCFCIKNGDVAVDALSFAIDGLFEKSVSISFSKNKVQPGKTLNAVIKAEPGSTTYTVGKDKRTDTIKNGSDLTEEMVRDSLVESEYGYFFPAMRYMFIYGWPWSFGGTDADSVIRSAKMLLLTDGYIHREIYKYYPGLAINAMADRAGGIESQPPPNDDSSGLQAAKKVRRNFVEVFLFEAYPIPSDSSGEISFSVTIPDTITTWVFRIFSVHPVYGLSIGATAEVVAIRDLFISLELPVSIVRNEIFCFICTLYSYYKGTTPVLLVFHKSSDFNGAFVKRTDEGVTMSSENKTLTDFYSEVSENEIKASKFCFTPTKAGDITLKVSALTDDNNLSDAVEQNITVKPEGVARANNYPSLINVTSGNWQKQVAISFPPNVVSDSQSVTINFVGNVLGKAMSNLKDLLKKPYGCGEQNMLNFAPSVCVLEFLLSTNTITPELLSQSKDFTKLGFMGELTYEHRTGGFSAFGDMDSNSSTCVFSSTANLDEKYKIGLDLNMFEVIKRTALYIIDNQNDDGTFEEHGVVFHVTMQGGSSKGEALTAYCLNALSDASANAKVKDSPEVLNKIQQSITKAGNYLASRIHYLNESYSLCIAAYALNKVNHTSSDLIFSKMEEKAITGDGLKYWKQTVSQRDEQLYSWLPLTSSLDVEATSYAMLTYSLRGIDRTEGPPVFRYLTNNLGPQGGYVSTQDTVMGLKALSTMVTSLHNLATYFINFGISYVDSKGQSHSYVAKLNKTNELVLHTIEIPYQDNEPSTVLLTANTDNGSPGTDVAFADVVLSYNVEEGETAASCYSLSHVLNTYKTGMTLEITVFSVSDRETSMSIIAVEVPSGHEPNVDEIKEKNPIIKRVDFNGDILHIYVDSYVINRDKKTVIVPMEATGGTLVKAEPKSYYAYDYYDSNCIQSQFYIMPHKETCDSVSDVGICPYVSK